MSSDHMLKSEASNDMLSPHYLAQDDAVSSLAQCLRLSSGLDFSPAVQQSLPFSDNGDVPFCMTDNVADCIAYLNQEMISIGLPSLYEANRKESFDICRLVNVMYQLLQRFRRCVKSRDDLQDSKYRAESDLEHRQQEKRRLQGHVEQLERDLVQANLREKQLVKMNKILGEKLKCEKEEVKKLHLVVQNRDAHYKHSLRKKESELARLKDRLHSLLVDKTELKIGLEVSDMLARMDGKRGRWKSCTTNSEEEIYRYVISNHEEKQKELNVENHEMREAFMELQKELDLLLQPNHSQQANDSIVDNICDDMTMGDLVSDSNVNVENTSDSSRISDGHFRLPYSLVHQEVLSDFRQKMNRLKAYIRTLESNSVVNNSDCKSFLSVEQKYKDQVDHLEQKLERYQSLVDQNQMDSGQWSPAIDVDMAKEQEKFICEKQAFYQQMTAFEEKKRELADVECQLNKERIAFEMEKCKQSPLSRTSALIDAHRPKSAMSIPKSFHSKRYLPTTPSLAASTRSAVITSPGSITAKRPSTCTVTTSAGVSLTQKKSVQQTDAQAAFCAQSISAKSDSILLKQPVMSLRQGTVNVASTVSSDFLQRLQPASQPAGGPKASD